MLMSNKHMQFPKDFFWGASTADHQIEGHQHNDWTEWEKANADRLAKRAPKLYANRSPVWELVKDQATDPANYITGRAADHWNLWREDFELASQIGINAYRMSISWSRIQPGPDRFDQEVIEQYRQMIKDLKRRGIEPFITIWHWPLPLWLSKRGGWTYEEISHYFIGYAALLVREFGADVKYWITLNEPNVYTENSFFIGQWPPQKRSPRQFYLSVSNLVKAHREAYHIIKSIDPDAKIGIANNFIPYIAVRQHWINRLLKSYADWRWNYAFIKRTKEHLDFIGVNHYFRYRINFGFNQVNQGPRSDLGWELYPPAIYHTLRALRRYNLPIFITESGLADHRDIYRSWYIRETLRHVHMAIGKGVDVRGYFHWSLMDNFEWDSGFWPRFGLIEIDYSTMKRRLRSSAKAYGDIIRAGGLPDRPDKYPEDASTKSA